MVLNTQQLLVILSIIFINKECLADKPTPTGEIIDTQSCVKKQVGGGKALIEIYKEGKNAFIGKLTVAANGQVPKHRDPTEEYLLIESGQGEITIDGKTMNVKAGDFIYMPAHAEVSFKNGNQTLIALQIFAGPKSARKYDKWQRVPPKKKD